MTDREKVIRGLECHATKGFVACQDCPYYPDELIYEDDDDMEGTICEEKLAADALALLKEQEARVMTENEAECDCPDCVYFETRTGWLECAIKDEGESDRYFGVFVYGCNEWFMRSYEEYGKTWRCWTSRPTPEQMRETKWEDSDAE